MSMPRIDDDCTRGDASPLALFLSEVTDDYMRGNPDTTWADVLRALEEMRHTLTEQLVHGFERERGLGAPYRRERG